MRKVLLSGGAVALALFSGESQPHPRREMQNPVPSDLVGPWLNDNVFKLIPAQSSPKPVGDLEGYVQHMAGVDANGKEFNTNAFIGDYKSPLLTPWGAAIP